MTRAELRASLKRWRANLKKATRMVKRRKKQLANAPRSLSNKGLTRIANYEGFRGRAYKPVPTERYWTIGYGHYGPDVRQGDVISRVNAMLLLKKDVQRYEAAVNKEVKVPLDQEEFDALVSLSYNIGTGAFASSTLVKKLNAGQRRAAADEFLRWDKDASGRPLAGLTRRRREERALFLS